MSERFVWILPEVIEALHEEQLAIHGGAGGVRDPGGLEAAIERPRMAAHYDDALDVFSIAALNAHAISKRHPSLMATRGRHSLPRSPFWKSTGDASSPIWMNAMTKCTPSLPAT